MNVSIYIIGTELLRGIIQDKHTSFIANKLTSLGLNILRSVTIPDDNNIYREILNSVSDSDILIVTGGLGPTSDDETREAIAKIAGTVLEKNEEAWNTLFKKVGSRIYGANEKQAYIPKGFTLIQNDNGTAPGFMGNIPSPGGRRVLTVCLPGPPREMQPMFMNAVLPKIALKIGKIALETSEYSVFLIPEAKLEELCQKVRTLINNDSVSWGTRFSDYKISLYLNSEKKEDRDLFIKKLRELTEPSLIEDGCTEAVDSLVNLLIEKKYTVSTAESATCGLIAKLLTDRSGSSNWYWGGVNSYNPLSKVSVLGVSKEEIEKNGMVTLECAKEMAQGVLRLSNTDLSISITGIAGPGGAEEGKPLGTAVFGFASKEYAPKTVIINIFWHSRESARRKFAVAALILAKKYLENKNLVDIVSKWEYI